MLFPLCRRCRVRLSTRLGLCAVAWSHSDLGLDVEVLPRGRRVVADGAQELLDVRLVWLRSDGTGSLHTVSCWVSACTCRVQAVSRP